MSGFAVAMQATSAVAQGIAQYKAGQAQASAARSQAEMLGYNAQVSAKQAEAIRQRGSYEAALIRQAGKRLLAQQRAAYASAGYATSTGTPLAMVAETAKKLEIDRMLKMGEYDVEANKQFSVAAQERVKAASLRGAAGYYEGMGLWGGTTTALTGLGQAYMSGIELGLFKNPYKQKPTTQVGASTATSIPYNTQGTLLTQTPFTFHPSGPTALPF